MREKCEIELKGPQREEKMESPPLLCIAKWIKNLTKEIKISIYKHLPLLSSHCNGFCAKKDAREWQIHWKLLLWQLNQFGY